MSAPQNKVVLERVIHRDKSIRYKVIITMPFKEWTDHYWTLIPESALDFAKEVFTLFDFNVKIQK